MIRGGLRTLLLAQSTVTAIVGSTGGHVGRAPQEAGSPRFEIQLVDEDENLTLDGRLGSGDVQTTEIDVDCKAETSYLAVQLRDAVASILRDYTGAAGSQTILAVTLNNKGSSIEDAIDGSDNARFVETLEFTIHWR